MNEEKLIDRIAQKDHDAFKAFVGSYQSLVLNTCCRILGNREDAEDVAQDVFVKVFEKAASFRGEASASTWVYRIAVNLSLNYRRKQKLNRYLDILTLSDSARRNPAAALETPDRDRPDRRLEQQEQSRILKEALDALPEKQRVAMVLHKFEGLSYQEIAEVLETSLSSVESLIHRAKRNLQKKLLKFLK